MVLTQFSNSLRNLYVSLFNVLAAKFLHYIETEKVTRTTLLALCQI